ncbi:maturation protease [Thermoplasma volcanium GSS1]|uniref:Maturation protease n=1 Tax=Thermoplasma volcanium (strain ATCC 51530 / DSM 4299 / JCM 9571 / NBRC 15438 / GSS1) TaxID=273116 RepID=Q97AJ7_THEVO|nr:maturation protease [Thermoplasma volcanium GSS1]
MIEMADVEHLIRKLSDNFEEYVVKQEYASDTQVRFSNSKLDLTNIWDEYGIDIFVSSGRKTASIAVHSPDEGISKIDYLQKVLSNSPENSIYEGINDKKQIYRAVDYKDDEKDVQDMAVAAISSAEDEGARRVSGLIYKRSSEESIFTRYNTYSAHKYGIEAAVRSFIGESSGQYTAHYGPSSKADTEEVGKRSVRSILKVDSVKGNEGKYRVIFSPMAFGNIISYGSYLFSAYSIISGMSYLEGRIGKEVANESFSLVDDPTDTKGIGFEYFDDEATATKRNTIIERGILKTYLHSYSTAKKMHTETTGNAGIISPEAWQLEVDGGDSSLDEMIADTKEGVVIMNSWYLRFQDYRNGVFSTVPRDGIYHIVKGEIKESWSGIRISDSYSNVLSNISLISKEAEYVKWWNEISASKMPYIAIDKVTLTRSF